MPKLVDHEARRGEVAAAACRVLAERGCDGATIREVAREVGCSTGVLAHYFADKAEMLGYALKRAGEQTGARMDVRIASAATAAEALRAVLDEALPLDAVRRDEWRVWIAFWGEAIGDAELAELQRARYSIWRGRVRTLLERGMEDGSLVATTDPDFDTARLIAFVDGLGIQATFEPRLMPASKQRALIDAELDRLSGL
jgi:AcrR family transcriptional regulator